MRKKILISILAICMIFSPITVLANESVPQVGCKAVYIAEPTTRENYL